MRELLISKGQFGFQYKDIGSASLWNGLPRELKTLQDVERYFMEGKDQSRRGRHDVPKLRLTDNKGKELKHYSLKFEADGSAVAVTDYNPKKIVAMSANDLWPISQRMNYLRSNAIDLPEDITELNEAVAYLRERESLTIEDYEFEVSDRGQLAAEKACKQHQLQYFPGLGVTIEMDKDAKGV